VRREPAVEPAAARAAPWFRTLLVAVAASAALASAAHAAGSPPVPAGSAVLQYVETVPTAGGAQAPGITAGRSAKPPPAPSASGSRVSPALRKALATIVSSPAYGAPPSPAARRDEAPAGRRPGSAVGRTLVAAADTIGGESDGRLLGLLGVLLATTVGAVALAARRRPL